MISIVLYGRNDSHGYNLPKRAAISFNCMAEVLRDPDDEILFVDCNTSNELPTFIEAIYDTLTPKAKSVLRVFRMRPQLYWRMVGHTHLFATEPHTRNVAIRRSNPRNRWILTTNTDMVFVLDKSISSLGDAVRDLPDGQYIAPRFEVPEPVWESFPRSDPQEIIRLCEDLGPRLHLHEVALRVPYMRFDSPGDFQLMPRQTLFDICGFDERMTHGWHADSNMCKRLCLYFGNRTESLAHLVKGYHCDHTRVPTPLHQTDIKLENNLQQFVWDMEEAVAHHQKDTWGAPNEPVEELDFSNGPAARYLCALTETLGGPQQAPYPTDANDARNFVFYYPEHALPYVAAHFTVYPPDARFVYAGNNPRMLELIAECAARMQFTRPLHYVAELLSGGSAPAGTLPADPQPAGDESLERHLAANYDLIIFDFGLDQTGLNLGQVARVTDWPRELRYSLGAVARSLEACSEQCDRLQRSGGRYADFLALNAVHYVFQRFIGQFMLATETPYPVHIRKGRARVGEDRRYKGSPWKYNEDLMRSYFAYDEADHSLAVVAPGHALDLTSQGRSARYKDGDWGAMDYTGSWIDGYRAAIVFQPDPSLTGDLVAYLRITEGFLNLDDHPIHLKVFFEGEQLARWTIYMRYEISRCKVVLPLRLMAGKTSCRLELRPQDPQSAQQILIAKGQQPVSEDPRELSIKVQQILFTGSDRLACPLNQAIDFTRQGAGLYHLDECWTNPDDLGAWTLGPEAGLDVLVPEPIDGLINAVFTITDAAVSAEQSEIGVTVAVNGLDLATWTIPTRFTEQRRILVPAHILESQRPARFTFRIDAPRSPKQLGWNSSDQRPLGFRFTKLELRPAGSLRYRLGALIDFAEGGDSITFIGDGLGSQWTAPDPYGSWTIGAESSMKVSFETAPAGDLPAAFVISDCNLGGSSPRLPVRVKANGHVVGDWTLGPDREAHKRSINIPAAVLAGSSELTLTFEIPDVQPAASLGWSDDPRPLGIRLARAVIGSAHIEIPLLGPQPPAKRPMIRRILGLPFFAVHVGRIVAKVALKKWQER
ncbi:MAG: hypothetical protein LAP38_17165 [Acidobacteriia bacterium]|nr:hypothetical protein [Terriglobia bacterium]